jgi:hypothetical protein
MRSTAVVLGLATILGGGCGGKAAPDRTVPLEGGSGAGFGDCVEPTPASTRAWASAIDERGRVAFCRDEEAECRTVDLATGAMEALFVSHDVPPSDQPGASIREDGVLGVCWGPVKCLTRPPGAYERWVDVKLEGRSRAAALAVTESAKRKVYVLDEALDTTLVFEVVAGGEELVWDAGRFLILVTEGDAVRGHLYGADGTPRGTVGAVEGARALDLGERSWPVGAGPPSRASSEPRRPPNGSGERSEPSGHPRGGGEDHVRWAFLSEDATTIAVHDLDAGGGFRIDTGLVDQAPASAGLAARDGTAAVVLGGTRYGDVLAVDLASRTVKPLAAKRCDGEDAP